MARGSSSIELTLSQRVPHGVRLLLAVSGGLDSMVLLHALSRLREKLALSLRVAHVDHGVRAASAEDAEFVRSVAKSHNVPSHVRRLPRLPPHTNFESWARAKRYSFFHALLTRHKFDFVVTAHHANDVAETFFMRLLSNQRLTSIQPRRSDVATLRPLLDVPRCAIESYAMKFGIEWREDDSNRDESYSRNHVRHTLLPFLKSEFEPRVIEVVAKAARRVDLDCAAIDAIAGRIEARLSHFDWGSSAWLAKTRRVLKREPEAIALRVVDRCLEQRTGRRFGTEHLERVRHVILMRSGAVELPGGSSLRYAPRTDTLRLEKRRGRR